MIITQSTRTALRLAVIVGISSKTTRANKLLQRTKAAEQLKGL